MQKFWGVNKVYYGIVKKANLGESGKGGSVAEWLERRT